MQKATDDFFEQFPWLHVFVVARQRTSLELMHSLRESGTPIEIDGNCPVCREFSVFRRDSVTDLAVAALQVIYILHHRVNAIGLRKLPRSHRRHINISWKTTTTFD